MSAVPRVPPAPAPYVAALLPFGFTLAFHGPTALAYDGHPLQRWEALLLLWLGAEVFRLPGLSALERLAYSAAATWLAVDETFMVHECVKWTWGLQQFGRDPLVAAYAAGGALVAVRVLTAHPRRMSVVVHLALAVAGSLVATLADLGILARCGRALAMALEEGGELLAVAAAISAFRLQVRSKLLPAAGWVALTAAWMGASVWLVRPWLCPPRVL